MILGAGMDTFAFRRPEMLEQLQVFEVDHPATQGFKRQRLSELNWGNTYKFIFCSSGFHKGESVSGTRTLNRPFAMALAAAWEQKFSYPLEIYVSNNSIMLMLPHSFALQELFSLISPQNLENFLRCKLESSGFFGAKFRENAGRALLLRLKLMWLTKNLALNKTPLIELFNTPYPDSLCNGI